MATKLDRKAASDKKMLSIKLHNPFITWTHTPDHLTNKKCYTCISTKPDNMVAYDKEPKLQGQMFFQSYGNEITWQIKKRYIFTSVGPMLTKLRRIMAYDKRSPPSIDMTQESFDK